MNESNLDRETSVDADRPGPLTSGEWYRSPLVLLAGLIVFAGVLALLVTSLTGGDDDVADVSTSGDAAAEVADPAPAAATLTFGGAAIPEVDTVIVNGTPLPAFTDPAADDAIGMTAPITTATSLASGTPVELGPGNARIIGFFAHWCPHCQAELPELADWLEGNRLPANTEFIAVSTAVVEDRGNYPPSAWFNTEGWATPVVMDDADASLLNAYGFTGFPAFIAVDADGVVVDRLGGNVGTAGFDQLAAAISG